MSEVHAGRGSQGKLTTAFRQPARWIQPNLASDYCVPCFVPRGRRETHPIVSEISTSFLTASLLFSDGVANANPLQYLLSVMRCDSRLTAMEERSPKTTFGRLRAKLASGDLVFRPGVRLAHVERRPHRCHAPRVELARGACAAWAAAIGVQGQIGTQAPNGVRRSASYGGRASC